MNQPDPVAPGLEIVTALHTSEGAGAEVWRLFPLPGRRMNLDPFMLFDHFHLAPDTGFPTHPHRGFEAITWLLEGGIRHQDSLGNDSTMTTGGAQRFTAGRGIEHSEMPVGRTEGIQLWINLPKSLKDLPPDYQAVAPAMLPEQKLAAGRRRIIVGEGSPLELQTPVRYEDVQLQAGGVQAVAVPAGWQGLIYVLEGELRVDDQELARHQAALFASPGRLALRSEAGARHVLVMGLPHREPVRQYGPYVD